MELIYWDSRLETAISSIDDDHKKIIVVANKLHTAFKKQSGRSVVSSLLEELKYETILHFVKEEEIMKDSGYPKYEYHKSQHTELIKQLDYTICSLDDGSIFVSPTTMVFLRDWLTYHILGSDRQFSIYHASLN